MDCDGTQKGYDLELLRRVSEMIQIPLIASGGAGSPADLLAAFREGQADAVLAASIFHYGKHSLGEVKEYLGRHGVEVRQTGFRAKTPRAQSSERE
jgi:cyclase